MSRSSVLRTLVAAAGLLGPAASAQDSFTNDEIGYRIRLPDGYEKAPGAFSAFGFAFGGDRYVVDQFRSNRAIATKDGWNHNPVMYALWFPTRSVAEIKKAELDAAKDDKEKAEGGEETVVSFLIGGRIYQDFKEYAEQRIGGFYFGDEKAQSIAGYPAVLRPLIFEKLVNQPQRWLSCSYTIPGGEFTLLFSAPESHADKMRADFMNAFKSFRVVRDGGLLVPPLNTRVEAEKAPDIDPEKMSPDQIRQILAAERDKAFAKALAEAGKGWKSFRTEHLLVLHETDPKYAKQAAQHAEDLREWLDIHFPGIGDGYEQDAILKVYRYDSSNTEDVSVSVRLGNGPAVETIHFRQPVSKGMDAEFAQLNQAVLAKWFEQKNDDLWIRLPGWLDRGLQAFVEDAEKVGGKLRFEPDEWEKDAMVDAFNAQKRWEKEKSGDPPLKDLRDLMMLTGESVFEGENWRYTPAQCASVCRFLVEGPGSRGKSASILRNYIAHLYVLVEEVEARIEREEEERRKLAAAQESMTDEEKLAAEDEAYKKKRKDAFDTVEKELLEKAFQQTFGDWTDADWRAFHRSWLSYAEGRTK